MQKIKDSLNSIRRRVLYLIDARPLLSFVIALVILFLVIMAGNAVRRPSTDDSAADKAVVRTVDVYSVGETPQIETVASVENTGVVTILAQTSGVVQSLNAREGDSVGIGSPLLSISNTYDGQNAAGVQQQLAYTQYNNLNDTYDTQVELIQNQRDLAEEADDESEAQREFAEESLDETNNLLDLNEDLLSRVKSTLDQLDPNDLSEENQAKITAAQSQEIQLTSSVNQLKSTRRSLTRASDEEEAPSEIAELTKEITLKQLELQKASLDLARESAWLQVELANINASLMSPSSPLSGVVEKVHVAPFQQVTPGMPLMTVYTAGQAITAEVLVSRDVAQLVSRDLPSRLILSDNMTLEVVPSYVSEAATDGSLHSVLFTLPGEASAEVTNGAYVTAALRLVAADSSVSSLFIPLEIIHQSVQDDSAGVFVIESDTATYKPVTLGPVRGRFVEVISGLESGDSLIVQRNVASGTRVIPRQENE